MGYEQLSLSLPDFDNATGSVAQNGANATSDAGKKKEKPADAALRFIPSSMSGNRKKPTIQQQKPATRKPTFQPVTSSVSEPLPAATIQEQPVDTLVDIGGTQKRGHSYEDWTASAEETQYRLSDFQRPRYSKKQKKEYEREMQEARQSSTMGVYEVAHPIPFGSFRRSEAHKNLNQWWRNQLRAAQERRRGRSQSQSSEMNDMDTSYLPARDNSSDSSDTYEPPVEMTTDSHVSQPEPLQNTALQNDLEQERLAQRERAIANMRAHVAAQAAVKPSIDDPSSQSSQMPVPPPPPPPPPPSDSPPHPTDATPAPYTLSMDQPPVFVPPGQPAFNTPRPSGSIIASAPAMLYARPVVPTTDNDAIDDEDNRSRSPPPPKKQRFGSRLLQKQGWQQGQGLGADGSGIKTAIIAKVDKRKRLPDSQGGGFASPANMGRIVGGSRPKKATNNDAGPDARKSIDQSKVVRISNMLAGLDVDEEIENNNLMQEIGEYMGEYGNVERLFIDRAGQSDVFVKFNSELSAIRAAKATDGTDFGENKMTAVLWDEEKFENGEYE